MQYQHLFNTLQGLFGIIAVESEMNEICHAVERDLRECEPQPGLYECTIAFTNEMNYTWKPGERVQVLRYSYQYDCCICLIPGEAQQFEMMADTIREHFNRIQA
ncbi:MAG: hypothetical protein RML37_12010 [Chitinophagales bacterium]|nr:hypothetical protein [Chitinophagales bacterium]